MHSLEAVCYSFSFLGNVTLGGNLSVAAGPVGRSAEASAAVVGFAGIFLF
jgi:lipid-binding SYLF domain-containing protein